MVLDNQQATVLAIDALEKMIEALRGEGPTPAQELTVASDVRYASRTIIHVPDQEGKRPRSSVWVLISEDDSEAPHITLDGKIMQLIVVG